MIRKRVIKKMLKVPIRKRAIKKMLKVLMMEKWRQEALMQKSKVMAQKAWR